MTYSASSDSESEGSSANPDDTICTYLLALENDSKLDDSALSGVNVADCKLF